MNHEKKIRTTKERVTKKSPSNAENKGKIEENVMKNEEKIKRTCRKNKKREQVK